LAPANQSLRKDLKDTLSLETFEIPCPLRERDRVRGESFLKALRYHNHNIFKDGCVMFQIKKPGIISAPAMS